MANEDRIIEDESKINDNQPAPEEVPEDQVTPEEIMDREEQSQQKDDKDEQGGKLDDQPEKNSELSQNQNGAPEGNRTPEGRKNNSERGLSRIKHFFQKIFRAIVMLPAAIVNLIHSKSVERISKAVGQEEAKKMQMAADRELRRYEDKENAEKNKKHIDTVAKQVISENKEKTPYDIVKFKSGVSDLGTNSLAIYKFDIKLRDGEKFTLYANRELKLLDNQTCPDDVKMQVVDIIDKCGQPVYVSPVEEMGPDPVTPEEQEDPEIPSEQPEEAVEPVQNEDLGFRRLDNGVIYIKEEALTKGLVLEAYKDPLAKKLYENSDNNGPKQPAAAVASDINRARRWYEKQFPSETSIHMLAGGRFVSIEKHEDGTHSVMATDMESGRKVKLDVPKDAPLSDNIKMLVVAVSDQKKYDALLNPAPKEQFVGVTFKGLELSADGKVLSVTPDTLEAIQDGSIKISDVLADNKEAIERLGAVQDVSKLDERFMDAFIQNPDQEAYVLISGNVMVTYNLEGEGVFHAAQLDGNATAELTTSNGFELTTDAGWAMGDLMSELEDQIEQEQATEEIFNENEEIDEDIIGDPEEELEGMNQEYKTSPGAGEVR